MREGWDGGSKGLSLLAAAIEYWLVSWPFFIGHFVATAQRIGDKECPKVLQNILSPVTEHWNLA